MNRSIFHIKNGCRLILLTAVFYFQLPAYMWAQEQEADSIYYFENENQNYTDKEPRIYLLNGNFSISHPQGRFGANVDKWFAGFSVGAHRQIQIQKPTFVGLRYTYLSMQSYSTNVSIKNNDGTIEEWDFTTRTSLNNLGYEFKYYLQPITKYAEIFFDVNTGINFLSTSTTFKAPGADESQTEYDLFTSSLQYGVGGGLDIPLGDHRGYISTRCSYNPGLSTRYNARIYPVPKIQNDTKEAFRETKSTTDLLKFEIGYTYAF